MKLSISAIPQPEKSLNEMLCFPIFVNLEEGKVSNIFNLKSSWSPVAFPMPENAKTFNLEVQKEHMNSILSYRKKIGFYCASRDFLSVDKNLLYHYIILGCEIQNALRRILVRLLPEMSDFKKITFNSICSTKDLFLKRTSPIIERTEELISAKLK